MASAIVSLRIVIRKSVCDGRLLEEHQPVGRCNRLPRHSCANPGRARRACSPRADRVNLPGNWHQAMRKMGGNAANRPRAADDFAAIRARMEELRREREETKRGEGDGQRDVSMSRGGAIRWVPSETSAGPGRVRQPGPHAARLREDYWSRRKRSRSTRPQRRGAVSRRVAPLPAQAASALVVRAARRAFRASCSSPSTRRWSASRRRRQIVTSSSSSPIVAGPIQPRRSAIEYRHIWAVSKPVRTFSHFSQIGAPGRPQ
jgi:hypothetical protein